MNIRCQQLNLFFYQWNANPASGRLAFADQNGDERDVFIQLLD